MKCGDDGHETQVCVPYKARLPIADCAARYKNETGDACRTCKHGRVNYLRVGGSKKKSWSYPSVNHSSVPFVDGETILDRCMRVAAIHETFNAKDVSQHDLRSVNSRLSALVKDGKIERVSRGVFRIVRQS